MKRKLQSIASQLSESDIQEIIRIKKLGDKKVVSLRRRRDKLAAELAHIDQQLAEMTGEAPEAPVRRRPGRKPGRPAASPGRRSGTRKRANLSAAVREVLRNADGPLRASQVVDGLPAMGIKVKDIADMRKRISVVLASQKNHFEQVERGVYKLKEK